MSVLIDSHRQQLERMLGELDERNRDNVARTESYLELYAWTRANPPDLPWLLMAHLVSRNAGYLMTDVRRAIDHAGRVFRREALEELFLFLERANYLIFHDAWHHVLLERLGRGHELVAPRTPVFIRDAYARYRQSAPAGTPVAAAVERRLVLDLVHNEQNYIENRVVHGRGFERARALVGFFEAVGAERSIMLGSQDTGIRVGRFASLERRIDTGRRLFDEHLADAREREQLYRWALEHPHTGSRGDHGGRPGPRLRDAWPLEHVRRLAPRIHAPPDPDPAWP